MLEGVIRAPRGAESEILKAGFVILNIRSVACQQCECSSEWYDFTVEGPREALKKIDSRWGEGIWYLRLTPSPV
jgi:hypothetical protein